MAANSPAGLKSAAIAPFLVRAARLEKAKPIISYWCTTLFQPLVAVGNADPVR